MNRTQVTNADLIVKITDLEHQLDLIKQSSESPGGSLDNQIAGMALLMQSVAKILKLPNNTPIRDLPAWAEHIMSKIPATTKL